MCRLSCTATLILSINNNPPHCRPGPHLLITICHLSNAPPLPSTPLRLLAPGHPKLCSPPLRPSQQGQLSSAPSSSSSPTCPPNPLPLPQPVSARVQPRDMVQHTEGCSLTLPRLTLTYFNCTSEGVEVIKK